jgi:hypothetical protein
MKNGTKNPQIKILSAISHAVSYVLSVYSIVFFFYEKKISKKPFKMRKEEFCTFKLWLVQLQENHFTRNNFSRLDDHPCLGDAGFFVIF